MYNYDRATRGATSYFCRGGGGRRYIRNKRKKQSDARNPSNESAFAFSVFGWLQLRSCQSCHPILVQGGGE